MSSDIQPQTLEKHYFLFKGECNTQPIRVRVCLKAHFVCTACLCKLYISGSLALLPAFCKRYVTFYDSLEVLKNITNFIKQKNKKTEEIFLVYLIYFFPNISYVT